MEFKDLGLSEDLLRGVEELGFENPTPIQEKTVPYLAHNESDLIALAQTGTGKTAAFGLPLLEKIQKGNKKVAGLIICPTRELCLQIASDLDKFSKHKKMQGVVAVYGGADIVGQMKRIKRGVDIVVATPGRLVDIINRRVVDLSEVEVVVLDEADEMLNMGFKDELDAILDKTPDTKNVWLFSATMPKEVSKIASNYMHKPFEITVGNKNEGSKNVEHIYYCVKERDRYHAIKRVIDYYPEIFGLIFCRTRRETQQVADQLVNENYSAEALHGDMSQAQRDRVMKKFRNREIQLLVATDVAARGIDVNDITHVLNYNLPDDIENYTHRSGRTGRAGKSGVSIVIINTGESRKIKSIERVIKKDFQAKELPKPDEITEKQLFHRIDEMVGVEVDAKGLAPFIDKIYNKFESYTKEELIERFVANEVKHLLDYYKKAKNLDADPRSGRDRDRGDRPSRGNKERRGSDPNASRYFVNLGSKQRMNPGALVRTICDETGLKGSDIGEIEILEKFSFFETSKENEALILERMNNAKFDNFNFRVELSAKKKGSGGGGRNKGGGGSDRGRSGGGRRKSSNSSNSDRRRSRRR
jgi:ATP-dependent RNA helicase DeaD